MTVSAMAARAENCSPITAADISKIQAYVTAHYQIPGGVTVVTDGMRYFPLQTCLLRVPLKAASATIPFHETLFLSANKRYLAKDLIDLSNDPKEVERMVREETIKEINSSGLPSRGADHGSVSVVVFSDFQCPYCNELNTILAQQILPKFGNAVTIRFRHLPLPSHKWSRDAARIGACVAEQSSPAFWTFTDLVFNRQRDIFSGQEAVAKMEDIVRGDPSLSWQAFEGCRTTGRSELALSRDESVALWYGIAATPTIFVDDIKIEGLPAVNALVTIIQTEISKGKSLR